jgi:hypothetical protein
MITDADISPDKEASFNSLVEERGGPGKFTDFQLDVALAVVGMMGDIRSERYGTPVERARTAEAAARLLELLPPPKPQSRESGRPFITTGMSLQDMANEYARAVADLDTTPDWDLEERPIIDAVAEPAPAPPPPARAPEPAPPPTYRRGAERRRVAARRGRGAPHRISSP